MDGFCVTRGIKRHRYSYEKLEINQATNFFCLRKHKFGRFISTATVQGGNRSVIIFTFNAGWGDITYKIDNFIKEYKGPFISNIPSRP